MPYKMPRARTLHTEASADTLKTRAQYRAAFARNWRDDFAMTRAHLNAGLNTRASDRDSAIASGVFPSDDAKRLFLADAALRAERTALWLSAIGRWGSYVGDALRSAGHDAMMADYDKLVARFPLNPDAAY